MLEGRSWEELPSPIKKFKLISEPCNFWIGPRPGSMVRQELVIQKDGKVKIKADFIEIPGEEPPAKAEYNRTFKIPLAEAEYLLAMIRLYFSQPHDRIWATDTGSWEAVLTDEDGNQYKFDGDLLTDEVVVDHREVSTVLRNHLKLSGLFAFDGNEREPVDVPEGEYIFVEVAFEFSDKTYCYIADDPDIAVEDFVLVPVGDLGNIRSALVKSIEVLPAEDAPYPVEKCKHIIRSLSDDEALDPPEARKEIVRVPSADKKNKERNAMPRGKDICEFADKWISKFEDQKINYVDLVDHYLADDCEAMGFEMDCGEGFGEKYGGASFDSVRLKRVIGEVDDIMLLGSAIYSRWRYFNHWAYSAEDILEPKNREWFIIALTRLKELANE